LRYCQRCSAERQAAGSLTGASADSVAQVMLSILPGFLLNLALLGPSGVAGFPDAIRALWPSPEFGLPG
jgi:TetR/AcrR family transcriptional regulator, transcriptional repressor of aconitase